MANSWARHRNNVAKAWQRLRAVDAQVDSVLRQGVNAPKRPTCAVIVVREVIGQKIAGPQGPEQVAREIKSVLVKISQCKINIRRRNESPM